MSSMEHTGGFPTLQNYLKAHKKASLWDMYSNQQDIGPNGLRGLFFGKGTTLWSFVCEETTLSEKCATDGVVSGLLILIGLY